MLKRFYCVRQHASQDCGPACLATISKYYGFKISISKLRELAGTDKQGTSAYGLVKAAEKIGLMAKCVKAEEISSVFEMLLPCIAHVIVNGNFQHYIVIYKITKKHIIVADPAHGIIKLPIEEFLGKVNVLKPRYKWTGILILLSKKEDIMMESESKGLFFRFMHLLLPHKRILFHIIFASFIYTILGVIGTFYYKLLVDNILQYNLPSVLTTMSLVVIVLNTIKVISKAFRSHLLLYLNQEINTSLLLGYYKHVINLPMDFFSTRKKGEIIARFNDAGKVQNAISNAVVTILIDIFMVVISGFILYLQDAILFFITFVVTILYCMIVVVFNHYCKILNEKQMEDNAELTSYLVETLNGIQTIKVHNAEREVEYKAEKKFSRLLESIFKLGLVDNWQESLKLLIELVGEIVILWFGGIHVIKGNMTIGGLVTFHSLLIFFFEPIKNLLNLLPEIQASIVAAERMNDILELEIEKTNLEKKKLKLKSLKGNVEFKNVNFSYGARRATLKNINLKLNQGENIAFVGESGSGKTTLAKLLLRLYKLEDGEILIHGNNINNVQIELLREKITYISQDTFLFSGSILENLSLGNENISLDDIISMSKLICAHDFINELPFGYETRLEENGANLSGGQKQRLAIVRALLHRPDILILDEATSNLDVITERVINEAIYKYTSGITAIFISHKISTIKNCDRIFVLEKGTIIEEGTHTELSKLNGKYVELLNNQLI